MTAVGMFAGRGDVVLALLVAAAASFWLGFWVRGRIQVLKTWWAMRKVKS